LDARSLTPVFASLSQITIEMHMLALVLVAAALSGPPADIAGDGQEPAVGSDRQLCMSISSQGRLRYGVPFRAQLPRGFELRLKPEDDFGWDISVRGPKGNLDYVWPVSPPYRTAPQRSIGPVYGLTAREAASFERDLRFVLSDADYDAAVKIVNEEVASEEKSARIEQLGVGRLTLMVTSFGLRKTAVRRQFAETFDWIAFRGEACVPR
jgi:hypothetical protein